MSIKTSELLVPERISVAPYETEAGFEGAIPDYCPDIARIIRVDCAPQISSYAAAGDVYAGAYAGRGGWSWYTGAAAWYCLAAAESLFGIKLRGSTLKVKPAVPFSAQLRFGACEIDLRCGEECEKATLDGEPVAMPFELTPGSHTLFLPVARK